MQGWINKSVSWDTNWYTLLILPSNMLLFVVKLATFQQLYSTTFFMCLPSDSVTILKFRIELFKISEWTFFSHSVFFNLGNNSCQLMLIILKFYRVFWTGVKDHPCCLLRFGFPSLSKFYYNSFAHFSAKFEIWNLYYYWVAGSF